MKDISARIKVGAVVSVSEAFGSKTPVDVTVKSVGRNKGIPVIDYDSPTTGLTHWAYFHQVSSIVKDA